MPRSFVAVLLAAVASIASPASGAEAPIPVKVVIVAMIEIGYDRGDRPGEFQYWVERKALDRVLPFPQGFRDLRMNDAGVLGIVTGVGTARAAASIMALGMDPRFDLTKAYWLVAGIAGIDPADASLGSAAWAEWVVDGDLAHEIDAREIPPGWKTGFVPLRRSVPYELPKEKADTAEVFRLDAGLVEWAYRLTKDVPLTDAEQIRRSDRSTPATSRDARRSSSRATRSRRGRSGSAAG